MEENTESEDDIFEDCSSNLEVIEISKFKFIIIS